MARLGGTSRLFLAALFGAELTTPATITGHGTVFGAPDLEHEQAPGHATSGRSFLEKVSAWLEEFGVETQTIHVDQAQTNTDNEHSDSTSAGAVRSNAKVCSTCGARIGYEYNRKRSGLAALAVQYLKHKQRLIAHREAAADKARTMAAKGISPQEIVAASRGRCDQPPFRRTLPVRGAAYIAAGGHPLSAV